MKTSALRHLVICTALATAATEATAQVQGALFTQPAEREYLDYLREEFLRTNAQAGFDIEVITVPEIPAAAETEPAGPIEINFGGVMTRRDASRSVWLNGRLLEENVLPAGMSLANSERTPSLRIAYEGKVYMLRPGQTVDLSTGNVRENFERAPASPTASPTPSQPSTSATPAAPEESLAAAEPATETSAPAPDGSAAVTAATAEEVADALSPLAAAILRLTPEQSGELAARLNDQAEAARTVPETEIDDADD